MGNLMEPMLSQYLLLVLLGVAAVTDLRTYTIPNWLTGPAVLAGITLHTVTTQFTGLVFSLEGAALGFGLFVILYVCGWMGAGDVKLYAAVGSFLGPAQTISAAIGIAIVGGLLALVVLALHQGWRKIGVWLWSMVLTRSVQRLTPGQGEDPKVPYAVAIGLGTIGSYCWHL
ncbi:A24 family peptidase [Nitrospira sp. NS4]|uniref:A24 family peptidase n=1 Tax=Nitrospira sp. NS4 TaxID=3414498 RepID=UPI003C2E4610